MKKFLISGADFKNKGGQSMLFITVSELRTRFPGCKIFYPTDKAVDCNYKITPVYYNFGSMCYMHGGKEKAEAVVKATAKKVLKKSGNLSQIKRLSEIFPTLDAVIDVSGYNLSSDWNAKINFKFLEYIRQAKKYGIPVYLMPQSFGPFEYGERQKSMDQDIKELLGYCKVVYAREKEGYQLLKEKYGLENVKLSPDLVLQNKGIDYSALFMQKPELKLPKIDTDHNVAIIPNMKSVEHGDKGTLLALYSKIIPIILESGRKVYIFRHSQGDFELCREIKDLFPEENNVVLLENDLNCLEYSEFICNFDFIIASRYHAIVHAIKQGVPCVALGWAVKYVELLGMFDMPEYVFRIGSQVDEKPIMKAVEEMCGKHKEISGRIKEKLHEVQSQNCYDILGGMVNGKRIDSTSVCHGLCNSCGICAGACPKQCITMQKSTTGQYLPSIDEEMCIKCGVCADVCQGKAYQPQELCAVTKTAYNGNLFTGDTIAAYTGYANDKKIREAGVSGGSVTAVVSYLLDEKKYDAAYLVGTYLYDSLVKSERFEPGDDLSRTPLSRYVTVSHEDTVRRMLEYRDEKLIIVAVPCVIHGLLQTISRFKLNRGNYLFLGLVCDKTMTNQVNSYFENIAGDSMEALYFRTKRNSGWPGDVGICSEGKTAYYPAKTRTRVKEYFQPERCLLCLDKLNRYADIAFGDDYTGNCSSDGGNIIFSYTELGESVLHAAPLVLTRIDTDEAYESMKLHVRKKNEDFIRCFEQDTGLVFCKEVQPDKHAAAMKEYRTRMEKIKAGNRYNESPAEFEKIVNKKPSLIYRVKRKLGI